MLVDEIVRNGGDIYTEYFPGKFADVANAFKVTRATVINLGQRLHLCAEREAHNPERSIRTLGFLQRFHGPVHFCLHVVTVLHYLKSFSHKKRLYQFYLK